MLYHFDIAITEVIFMTRIGLAYVSGAVPGFEDFGNLPTDIVKENDLYICQYCGCKYTIESVKKMIVDIAECSRERVMKHADILYEKAK